MKHLFTLLFTIITALPLFAERPQSSLSISIPGRAAIVILVDDIRYEGIRNNFSLDELSSGYHNIKVYEARDSRRKRFELLYASSVYFKPMHHVNIFLNGLNKVVINERPIGRRDNRDYEDRNNDWDNDRDRRGDDRDRRDDDRWDDRGDHYNRGGREMHVNMYNSARESIRRERFDDDRLRVARNILKDNYLSSAQVKELAMIFSFDSARLEFAKFAYSRTVDRNNYFIVSDAFTFNMSKRELEDHCQKFR
jgi:hypothetical protein